MIRIDINDKEIMSALDHLVAKAIDQTPVMRRVAGIMAHSVEENFAAQGRPRWPSLKPATIKARERKGNWPGKILQARGDLAASIQSDADAHSAIVGTNKRYAAAHQFGGPIPIPERSGTVRLRTDARGNLMRQEGSEHLARFAGKRHKRAVERSFIAAAHEIQMPARPFLALQESDKQAIVRAIAVFLV